MKKHLIPILIAILFFASSINSMVIGFEVDAVSEVAKEVEPETTIASGPMDSPWPMYSHDLSHSGRSSYSTSEVNGLEKWRFKASDGVDGGICIDNDGILYFGDKDSILYAVYPNGTLKWRYEVGMWITSTPTLAEDGTLYVTSWDKKLWAFDSIDGKVKWKFNTNYILASSSPIVGDDGTIYFGTAEGNSIFAINPNGTEKWRYKVGNDIYSTPAICGDGMIYIGSTDNYLYVLYPNGTLHWKFKTGDKIYGSPSIANDGTIYIGSSWDGYLYALYPNGTLRWKYKGAGTPSNPSIGSDGIIYAGYLEKLVSLYPNGTLKWKFELGNNRRSGKSAPAISSDGTIYFGTYIGDSSGGEIIAINPDGTEKWRKQIARSGWVDSSPSIAEDGTVYIGSQCQGRGYLHAFGPVESNIPPEPPTISGKTNGEAGEKYWYTFSAIEPDNNPFIIYIDWGDENEGWKKHEYASGEKFYYPHTWDEEGNYTIRAKAKDVLGEESDWGYLEVTMPKSQNVYHGWLERFPRLQKILDVLRLDSR